MNTGIPKRSMREVLGARRPATEAEKHADRLSFAASVQRWQAEFAELQTTPDWRAMDKLTAGIAALKDDPEIAASEGCKDLLDTLQELLDRAWPHQDIKKIVSPMQAHFDGVRGKEANDVKKKKVDDQRIIYGKFLDSQKDVADTTRLAARLRKTFGINSERGSLDEVRLWKKLRRAGKT